MTSVLNRSLTPSSAAPEGASPHAYDVGLLLVRVVLGVTVAAHGAQKLFGWFGGGGIEGTGQFFTMSGYPSGRTMAVIAGLSETLGGLGLVLGLLTPLAGAAVLGTMINALAVKWGGGFFAPAGVEYEVLLLAGAAGLALTGPGRIAVDRFLPGLRAHRLAYGVAAVLLAAVIAALVLLIRN
ncbi:MULTISPECIES: DoxX family protein [Streptomyces]|uniref:DoxX family membrane protein n=1 Tax=Streptomyces glycanivorans TaxID=3033808 RepID=A0ABY9JLD2_9ACTN|nr:MULTISPECIES: DoxX family membrane protein [unclassified Streptomyces]WSQ81893.1 DoxX family membrane protein [Streptomyces sp. NBC_01213]TXS12016.1 DoxX family membrane protein [Streptomyces sp. wa22]WLQ68537.1 DoxX family membrane protein [Streptomyces sp. Alt3]WSQ89221.1 DoxX family membrane protein [Streptomyces sp. NBC_01212]WSR04773.1 DoxX family membrane protein [Streptomyces sp. NBC_01208]